MSAEMEAFHALELLSDAFPGEAWSLAPGEFYSPTKAKDGDYSARLKQGRKAHPPEGGEEKQRPRNLTPQQKIASLRKLAADLLEHQTPFPDRLPLLRAKAEVLGITLRDQELQRYVGDARRAANGTTEPLKPGDVLSFAPCPWHWEGVLMASCFNLLTGLPKTGKTSLVLAMLAAWSRGEPSFLGMDLIGPCPPVLIVGTDQPESDWARMLWDVGLLDGGELPSLIVGLFHKGRPIHLDHEGIERISSYAIEHQRLLILLDSVSACTSSLGLKENDAEFVDPFNDLMEAISPYGTTFLAIHHSSKGRQGESATLASRGSTALPAAASQVIALAQLASPPAGPPDRRIVLKTEGRGGLPVQLLIERTEAGWITHGSAEAAARAQVLLEAEEKLNDRQTEALQLVRERWSNGQQRTDAATLARELRMGGDSRRKAQATLDSLARRGLLTHAMQSSLQGQVKQFWPVEASEASRGVLSDHSCPSEPSEHQKVHEAEIPSSSNRSEGSDSKEPEKSTPREPLRTSPAGRVSVLWKGQAGWSRSATARRGAASVMLSHSDGRQGLAGWDEITDEERDEFDLWTA
jgi:hypothetical protein